MRVIVVVAVLCLATTGCQTGAGVRFGIGRVRPLELQFQPVEPRVSPRFQVPPEETEQAPAPVPVVPQESSLNGPRLEEVVVPEKPGKIRLYQQAGEETLLPLEQEPVLLPVPERPELKRLPPVQTKEPKTESPPKPRSRGIFRSGPGMVA